MAQPKSNIAPPIPAVPEVKEEVAVKKDTVSASSMASDIIQNCTTMHFESHTGTAIREYINTSIRNTMDKVDDVDSFKRALKEKTERIKFFTELLFEEVSMAINTHR